MAGVVGGSFAVIAVAAGSVLYVQRRRRRNCKAADSMRMLRVDAADAVDARTREAHAHAHARPSTPTAATDILDPVDVESGRGHGRGPGPELDPGAGAGALGLSPSDLALAIDRDELGGSNSKLEGDRELEEGAVDVEA
eukprot:tig00021068_g17802.t1